MDAEKNKLCSHHPGTSTIIAHCTSITIHFMHMSKALCKQRPRLWNVSTVENNLGKFAVANESAFSNQELAPPSQRYVKDDELELLVTLICTKPGCHNPNHALMLQALRAHCSSQPELTFTTVLTLHVFKHIKIHQVLHAGYCCTWRYHVHPTCGGEAKWAIGVSAANCCIETCKEPSQAFQSLHAPPGAGTHWQPHPGT